MDRKVLGVQIENAGLITDGVTNAIRIRQYCDYVHVKATSYSFNFQYVSICRSVKFIVFLSSQYVEFRANKTAFAGSFNLLL